MSCCSFAAANGFRPNWQPNTRGPPASPESHVRSCFCCTSLKSDTTSRIGQGTLGKNLLSTRTVLLKKQLPSEVRQSLVSPGGSPEAVGQRASPHLSVGRTPCAPLTHSLGPPVRRGPAGGLSAPVHHAWQSQAGPQRWCPLGSRQSSELPRLLHCHQSHLLKQTRWGLW